MYRITQVTKLYNFLSRLHYIINPIAYHGKRVLFTTELEHSLHATFRLTGLGLISTIQAKFIKL